MFVSGLALIVVMEVVLRILAIDPGESPAWSYYELDLKFRQMTEFAEHGERFDVVFLGSSMAGADIDPQYFSESSGLRSYNAAFDSASLQAIRTWGLDVVEPLLKPKTVVLAISSREFNDEGDVQRGIDPLLRQSDGYKAHVAITGSGVFNRITSALDRWSYIVRLRQGVRNWKAPLGRLPTVHGPLGARLRPMASYNFTDDFADRWRESLLGDYRIGGDSMAALLELQDELAARSVELVVLLMPVTQDYIEMHPRGIEDYEAFKSAVRRFCSQGGFRLLDAGGFFETTEYFSDPVHLDKSGQAVFSESLGDAFRNESTSGHDLELLEMDP